MSDSVRSHESQHVRPPCPSPTPGVHSDSRPLSQWCHPTISSSVVLSSSCPQSFPASKSFPMSQFFAWGGQSTGVSALASFLPKKSQGWSPSEWTGWISLQLVKWYLTYVVKQNALAIPGMESCGHFPQGKKRAHIYMKYGAHNSEISSPSWEALLWRLYENHW